MSPELQGLANFLVTVAVGIILGLAQRRQNKKTNTHSATATEAVKQLKSQLKNAADDMDALKIRIQKLEGDLSEAQARITQLRNQITEKDLELAAVSQQRDNAIKDKNNLQKQIQDGREALQQTIDHNDELEKRIAVLESSQIGKDAVEKFIADVMEKIAPLAANQNEGD